MATKAEERKALEQIRKIIEGLGENSYIGTAMAGMIEDAEENINNDWAMSWMDRARTAEEACDLRREEALKLRSELDTAMKETELRDRWLEQKTERIDDLLHQLEDASALIQEKTAELRDKENLLAKRDTEIIALKAKLYDLMTSND